MILLDTSRLEYYEEHKILSDIVGYSRRKCYEFRLKNM
jgi:hypothetical protein